MDHLGNDTKKILITGSLGFLGKEIKDLSLKYGSKYYFTSRINNNNFKLQCDLTKKDQVKNLSNYIEPDYIIHCASEVPKNQSEYNITKKGEINIIMLSNILAEFECPIIFISSMTVYGQNEKNIYSENDALNPISQYGYYKALAEKLLMKSKRQYLSLRIPGLFGPNRKNGLIYNVINSVQNDLNISLPDKPVLWAGMHVTDAAKAILDICQLDWKKYRIINIGYRDSYSINKLLSIISKVLNKNIFHNIKHPIFQYDLKYLDSIGIIINSNLEISIKRMINEVK